MTDPANDPAKDTIEHLQNAALEIIRATRSFLDLAEDLIGDMAVKGRTAASQTGASQTTQTDANGPSVQHIRVS